MKRTKNVFAILDTKTGLFSTGGYEPQWTKQGKVWNSIGSLKNHLQLYARGLCGKRRDIPASWEVVTFEVVTSPSGAPLPPLSCSLG